MLVHERNNISEVIDFDKTDQSKECMIGHNWFFKDKNFNFENLPVMVVKIFQSFVMN